MSTATQSLPLGLRLWRAFTACATPFASLLLSRRAGRGKEDQGRLAERLGVSDIARPAGRLIWIHGASVGESLAALPLIEKLQAGGNSVLVTSGTGETILQAKRAAYSLMKRLILPNSPMYRTDIGDRLKKQLPLLQELGYAQGMEWAAS